MSKFEKILVPLDGSSNSMRGLDKAISIAKTSDAEITGFYVFNLPLVAGIKYTSKMKANAQDKAVKAIGPAMRKCEQAGAHFKYQTSGGKPPTADQIVTFAKKGNYDMIVVGARGIGGAKETLLGSVSNKIMHKSQIPVLIVK